MAIAFPLNLMGKLIPSDDVKYLGVHLDKYLSWDLQTNQLSKKLIYALF